MTTPRFVLVLALLALPACDAVVGDTNDERRAREVEVNEALTISHLKSIQGAQLQFQALGLLDEDGDDQGEFGFLAELSGAAGLRGSGATIKFPLLTGAFRRVKGAGFVQVHGYLYRVYLPGPDGTPVGEGARTKADVDVDAAERTWVLYAWPAQYGESGRRSFFVSAAGAIHAADLREFSGGKGPEPFAAFEVPGDLRGEVAPAWSKVD